MAGAVLGLGAVAIHGICLGGLGLEPIEQPGGLGRDLGCDLGRRSLELGSLVLELGAGSLELDLLGLDPSGRGLGYSLGLSFGVFRCAIAGVLHVFGVLESRLVSGVHGLRFRLLLRGLGCTHGITPGLKGSILYISLLAFGLPPGIVDGLPPYRLRSVGRYRATNRAVLSYLSFFFKASSSGNHGLFLAFSLGQHVVFPFSFRLALGFIDQTLWRHRLDLSLAGDLCKGGFGRRTHNLFFGLDLCRHRTIPRVLHV